MSLAKKTVPSIYLMCTFSLLGATSALATGKYECATTHVVEQTFSIEGELEAPPSDVYLSSGGGSALWNLFESEGQGHADAIALLYVGKKFWIDRSTGQLSGDINSNSFATHRIVSEGNAEWSFKLIVEGHPNEHGFRHAMYVEIAQYANSSEKPFSAIGLTIGNGTLAGTCVEK